MAERYYIVKQGDWLSSIAKKFGIGDWKKIYDYPKNKEFKEKRPDPNIIYPGDELFIPEQEYVELEPKRNHSSTYRIEVEIQPKEKIELVIKDGEDNPIANEFYTISIGGYTVSGKTDSDGRIVEEFDSKLMLYGYYILEFKGKKYGLNIGHIDPVTESSGILQRLVNLGYAESLEEAGKEPERCIKRFQAEYGLKITGIGDDETLTKLENVYQSKEKRSHS